MACRVVAWRGVASRRAIIFIHHEWPRDNGIVIPIVAQLGFDIELFHLFSPFFQSDIITSRVQISAEPGITQNN